MLVDVGVGKKLYVSMNISSQQQRLVEIQNRRLMINDIDACLGLIELYSSNQACDTRRNILRNNAFDLNRSPRLEKKNGTD